jgi:medium-chain acyl-[acyl-carrier-protein] hydrolase
MDIDNKWVIRPATVQTAKLTLFCFSYAGGGASAFRGWNEQLLPNIEVRWVQLPGRENRIREQPIRSMDDLAPALAKGILPCIRTPFAFYGHSLGAKVAFETTRVLRRIGSEQPCHLFVGASDAPQLGWPHPLIHALPDNDFIHEIQQRYDAVPPEVLEDAELMSLLIPTLRADITLVEKYRYIPESPLDCPITAFGGKEDRNVERSALDSWRHQTSARFRLYEIDGSHFFLHSAQKTLLGLIAAELESTQSL